MVSKVGSHSNCDSSPHVQGMIIKSERMEVEVGGRDAMADLVEGTQELAVQDGQGSAGWFKC